MLTCREVSEAASRYLDAELPWRARAGIRLHLMMCRHCRRYVDQLARTVALLRALKAAEAPDPAAEERVLAALADARARARGGSPAD